MVASHIANNEKKRPVLFISPDEGNRYVSSVYSNDWLKRNRALLDLLPRVPKLVTDPKDAKQQWSYINWDRRKLSDVIEKLK
jgi:mRNA-degrading endonuclease toxin of MazEF toxin-antitoxin module